jgi:protein tyrosine phosphatase (PTP) superfamily phosphohydrolase (DUF442 family)
MDVSRITDYLYISSQLDPADAARIHALNVGLIISMIRRPPPPIYTYPPFRIIVLKTNDSPLFPIPLDKLMVGAEAALAVIQDGNPVLVYCQKGRHRSVAMASAILIAMGHTADEAMKLIRQMRHRADPQRWYIRKRIRLFELEWKRRHPS